MRSNTALELAVVRAIDGESAHEALHALRCDPRACTLEAAYRGIDRHTIAAIRSVTGPGPVLVRFEPRPSSRFPWMSLALGAASLAILAFVSWGVMFQQAPPPELPAYGAALPAALAGRDVGVFGANETETLDRSTSRHVLVYSTEDGGMLILDLDYTREIVREGTGGRLAPDSI